MDQSIPRRQFLVELSAAAGIVGVMTVTGQAKANSPGPAPRPVPPKKAGIALERVTLGEFSEWVGSKFRIRRDGTVQEVELIDATRVPSPYHRPSGMSQRSPFSVVFRAPQDALLPQGTYKLQHHKLGALELLLVPIGQDAEGIYCEAVFN